jgi:acetyl-CoA carboxylase biotin carboxyl carrier protein
MAQPKDPAGAGEKGSKRIDPALVRELAELLTANELTEIEVEDGDRRIKVKREAPSIIGAAAAPAFAPAAVAPALTAPPMHAKEDIGQPAQEEVSGETVKSPMVGTAYLAPQPGAPPFVRPGDSVVAGQPLLIIEAMKVMNQIRAPRAGRIERILIADGEPVEYGAVLLLIA